MTDHASPFALVAGVLAFVVLAFLGLPIVALLTAVPPADLPALLTSPAALNAMWVSLETNLIANLLILTLGTPTAYLLARCEFRGKSAVLTLIELPLVLPPAVAGVALLAAFGAGGLLGSTLAAWGIVIPFTTAAVVLAVAFVAAPFYLRAAISAFAAIDRSALDAARDLGASEGLVFRRIALPMAADGLRTGWALAFARGAGEFGATLLFAGSVARVTETLPLAVYAELGVSLDAAIAIGILLLALSGAVLVVAKLPTSWSPATPGGEGGRW
jgi:molybdate transport system permease protein